MFNVSNGAWSSVDELLQALLPRQQRQGSNIFPTIKQLIKYEEDEFGCFSVRKRRLQSRETGGALVVQRNHFPVDDSIGKICASRDDLWKFLGPVQPFSRPQGRRARRYSQLHAVAIKFDLVRPPRPRWRLGHRLGQLRLDEIRRGGGAAWLSA